MMGRGVVKEQRQIRVDVLNSTSSPRRTTCVGCLNWRLAHFQFGSRGVRGRGEMNLYRSFGNLLEAWVTEGGQCPETAWLGNNDEDLPTPSSDDGTNLRSESVDSGVETASSVMSLPATPCSVSTDAAEIDRLTPASTSQSPVFSSPVLPSSSSLHLRPNRAQVDSTALHLKVERALQKTDSKHLKNHREPLTVDEVLSRRPQPSFGPKRHASELVRGQRSPSSALARTVNPSVPRRQMSEMHRRPLSTGCDMRPAQTRSEDLGEQEKTRLSPGLFYLEQVCQMLEEIARKQMHSRATQMETNALQEPPNTEVADTCQSDSNAAEEELSNCQSLENIESAEHSEPPPQRDYPNRHFRQRSASDTNISTPHRRKMQTDCRGQHLSIDDLLEKDEEDHEKQGSEKEATNSKRNWKMKFNSLKIGESAVRDTNGQQMQSSERNSARRRLSQMFRRKKARPV
ncbi:uncharacterized protein si:dkey-106l3.7 isoform X2 [Clinocottus analis]|uniref:uncharacterized protein si:dkey-106l3.7 isoform X2 n=1 Tax=Clinocottus analis TaxID=304258 RepID=UPI0035C17277